jgi:hypothetical protein
LLSILSIFDSVSIFPFDPGGIFLYQWFTVLSDLLQYWSQFLHNCSYHFLFVLCFSKLILRILLLWVWGRLLQYKIDWWLVTYGFICKSIKWFLSCYCCYMKKLLCLNCVA